MSNELIAARKYYSKVSSILDQVINTQAESISKAADVVVKTVDQGGAIYLFGTGHSHLLAEEGHFRAGGLVPVIPILISSLMLHESAINSGKLERMPGLAAAILSHYQTDANDIMIIFSNSGVNAVPVEMALEAKKIGMQVVGVLALSYAQVAPLSSVGKRLNEIVDIVVDNQIQAGDAVLEVGKTGLFTGPASTIVGAFILNAILTEAICRMDAAGKKPPIYISSNMPGAAEHNQKYLTQAKARNPHL
jgi:uncharacterized phosphosugar-binding protein